MQWQGSFVPLITPFDRKGRLDRKTLEKLVEWHISEGTDGLVCSATTGEGPTLSDLDRKKVAEICIRTAAGRIPVIVATGINCTRTSIRYTEMALKQGADGCLVVTPYYNKPSQKGCVLHFQEVAKVGLPIIVYHNPPRTAIRLTLETLTEIAQIPNIVALKDSGHDLELVRKAHKLLPIFSGDDDLTFDILKEGGVGSIVVLPNFMPRIWKKLITLCLQKQWDKVKKLEQHLIPLIKAVFLETNPQGIKFLLSYFGKCHPTFRLPMTLPSTATQTAIKRELIHLFLPQYLTISQGTLS